MAKRSSRVAALRSPEPRASSRIEPFPGTDWTPIANDDEDEREQSYLRKVRPQSEGQLALMQAIERHHLTLALGPAGTGKTYLAVSAAVEAFEASRVGRIVLTRPAVEAGESLGFLPGDMNAKLAPYLRPLDDALTERLGGKRLKQLIGERAIEIVGKGEWQAAP